MTCTAWQGGRGPAARARNRAARHHEQQRTGHPPAGVSVRRAAAVQERDVSPKLSLLGLLAVVYVPTIKFRAYVSWFTSLDT